MKIQQEPDDYFRKPAMNSASHTVREELRGIVIFIGIIWAVFLASLFFPSLDSFGIVPRKLIGLVGIPLSPFLHANFHHLLGNTIPLFLLLTLLAGSKARSFEIVIEVILLGGLLLWIFGRNADHIGASGLIFGLIVFLILSGVLEKRTIPLIVAAIVGFLYGGTLLWGILPSFGSDVSWDGHLCGAISGGLVAYGLGKESPPREAPEKIE
jgi:membrane associated rhomboid family serine protease